MSLIVTNVKMTDRSGPTAVAKTSCSIRLYGATGHLFATSSIPIRYYLDLALEPREDHAPNIASWTDVAQNDRCAVLAAATHVERAMCYPYGLQQAARRQAG